MQRFIRLPPAPEFVGDLDGMSLLADETVGQINAIKPVGDVNREMTHQAEDIIGRRLPKLVQALRQTPRPRNS